MEAMEAAELRGFHGLLFQHVTLCSTRVWLHYHRIDCAHLNRHMQSGLYLHETSYARRLDRVWGYGIRPDQIDFDRHTVTEVKSRNSFAEASRLQLAFYMTVLIRATEVVWTGTLRYPSRRQIEHVDLTLDLQTALVSATSQIVAITTQTTPPPKLDKPVCSGCSYRLLCWGQSTEDLD